MDRHEDQLDDNETNVPHFQSNFRLEKYLQQQAASPRLDGSHMIYTILRLPCFMENLMPDIMGRLAAMAWKLALYPMKKMQLISTRDIARFVDQAFNNGRHMNMSISIVGDDLTFGEANGMYFRRFGKNIPTTYEFLVKMMLYWIGEFGVMMKWFNNVGYKAGISALRE